MPALLTPQSTSEGCSPEMITSLYLYVICILVKKTKDKNILQFGKISYIPCSPVL